ncbi:MAG: AAA family ATPase [Candidatus Moraniibacteriota bacterium]
MSRVIVVCGQAGVGKTTLSVELSKKLNIFCLHKDTLKERLFDLLGGGSLKESRNAGMISMELLFHLAEESIRNGVDIMIESPFNHPSNPGIFERWQNDLGVDMKIIVCELKDEVERKKRFSERVASGNRHHSHQDFDRNWVPSNFDYSIMPDPKLFLDMSQSHETNVGHALRFLQDS